MKSKRFWECQFSDDVTENQMIFDVMFGIVFPLIWVLTDPFVFKGGALDTPSLLSTVPVFPLLRRLAFFGYVEIIIGVLTICVYLDKRPHSQIIIGVLLAEAILSCGLGVILVFECFSVYALFSLIGVFLILHRYGVTPFVATIVSLENALTRGERRDMLTIVDARRAPRVMLLLLGGILLFRGLFWIFPFLASFVFLRNTIRGLKRTLALQSRMGRQVMIMSICILTIVVPVLGQVAINVTIDATIQKLVFGNEREVKVATFLLKFIPLLVDLEALVEAYDEVSSPQRERKIAQVYGYITGKDIYDAWTAFLD